MRAHCTRCRPVYPRWRGEHALNIPTKRKGDGLSPLARGTQLPLPGCSVRTRFIPAGAGNTSSDQTYYKSGSVYPRWRGEHFLRPDLLQIRIGLSPLARGTRKKYPRVGGFNRFIPAGAGNTLECGLRKMMGCGLSPLARGTLLHVRQQIDLGRFIPAGAGNTKLGGHKK